MPNGLCMFAKDGRLAVVNNRFTEMMCLCNDLAHRGFVAFRWLAHRLRPPLWLHGHTALVRRGIDDRSARLGDTTFYNCTGATLVELMPPDVAREVDA